MNTDPRARTHQLAWAIALTCGWMAPAWAADYMVNTNGSAGASADAIAGLYCDSNPAASNQQACTLAAAIDLANLSNVRDSIAFDLPTITLTASLPTIVHPVDIEGDPSGEDPGTAIDAAGQGLFAFANGASLNGGSSITNLKLMNAGGNALQLDGSPYIVDNLWVGLNAAGTAAAPSGLYGIEVQNTVSKTPPLLSDLDDLLGALGIGSFGELFTAFGGNPAAFVGAAEALLGQDNLVAITNSVISGNEGGGVRIAGGQDGMGNAVLTAGVILAGNRIGTNASGTGAVPNGTGTSGDGSGVLVEINAALNFVIGNVIAANEGQGVNLVPGEVDFPNIVGGNFIGLPNPTDVPNPLGLGASTWGNFESGVFVGSRPSAGNASGTSAVVAANFIGFNRCGTWDDVIQPFSPDSDDAGVSVTSGSDRALVVGNLIGVAEFPPGGAILDLGNLCTGIYVSNGSNTIGGANILDANAIGANDGDGILLSSNNTNGNVVKGNRIGRDYTDSATFANSGYGIRIVDSGGNVIGFEDGDAPLFGPNVIAAPGASGIRLDGGNAFGNLLRRNRIYGWPAGFIGIELDRDAISGQDIPDPIDDDDNDVNPLIYANWAQNAPQVCTSGIPAGPCVGASGPSFGGGNTSVQWTLFSFRNATFRIDAYAVSDDEAQWLHEVEVSTDGNGYPVNSGPCDAQALCTSSFASDDTRGSQILLTATRIDADIADIPPLEPGDPVDDGPINNTSEFSNGVVIPDQIVFGQADYVVAENEGIVTLTVSRVGTGAASITLTLTDLTTQPADHGALGTTTLSWSAGEAPEKTVDVPIVQDAIDEPNQHFEVSFVIDASDNAAAGTPATTEVTITDDDAAPLLTIAGVGAVEGDDLAYTITRQGDSEFTVSVDYTASPQPGTEAGDIDGSSGALAGTAMIAPSDATAVILVHAVDDAIHEPAEDVLVALANPVNAVLGGPGANAAIATIAASDTAPVFNIDSPMQDETDVDAAIVFTVTKVGTTELAASVGYATADGSATTPADYLAGASPLAGTLNFAAGDAQQTIALLIVGDDVHEPAPAETFAVQLSNPIGASLGTATGTAAITDDDPAQVGELRFTAATFDVVEGDAPVDAIVTVERVGGSDGAASVECVPSAGTATAGADFTAAAVLASWNDGESGTRQCLVPIAGDLLNEQAETVLLGLANAVGAPVAAPSSATLAITDNDPQPLVSVSPPMASTEGDGGALAPFTFLVQLSAPSGREVTVQATSQDGTATVADNDYQPVDLPVVFAVGDTQQMVVVNVIGDATDEDDQTFGLQLTAPNGAALANTPEIAVATILDDDAPPPAAGQVRFTTISQTVGESAGPAVIAVERINGSDGAVSVDCVASAGTAGAADFTPATQTLDWADGVDGTQACMVAITPDALDEDDETVTLVLANPQGGVALDSPSAATLTITDDDAEPVLSVAGVSLPEGDGPGATSFDFVVALSAPSGRTVSVTASTADGTAVAPGDYAASSSVLNFAPGSTSQAFTVAVVGDSVDESIDETFAVTLSAPSNAVLAANPTATGTIGNDDAPAPTAGTLQFGAPTYSIGEAGVQATITVTRVGGSSGAIAVDFASSNGSATAGSDYTAVTGTLEWADGDVAPKAFDLPVTDDATDEPDETLSLTLSAPTNGATLGAPATAVLTILDDDPAPVAGTLQFSAPTYSVGEAGLQATITVTRTGGSSGAVTVDYASSDGSATAGSDYTAAAGTLAWADGDTTAQAFDIAVSDDATDEPDETVTLSLANPTGGAALGSPQGAVLTLVDDDTAALPGTKSFSGPTQTGTGTQSVVFTGGGDACGFAAGTALVAAPTPLPAGGYVFPHGVFASTIDNCTVGATLSFTATYPQALPAGTVFWKYGRTQANPGPAWYQFPATVSGNTVTFTLVDGGPGDDDLTANGTLVDPSGPAFLPGTAPPQAGMSPQLIPTMGEWSTWLLLLLVAGIAAWQFRARSS